ncbi:hypothetical protein LJC11_03525 [Bacteroidales bacterium OttesenSCG-928-I21]|nr:hypothetical protein [Bacteroidales bacterium OttesenSCG-928-I21]
MNNKIAKYLFCFFILSLFSVFTSSVYILFNDDYSFPKTENQDTSCSISEFKQDLFSVVAHQTEVKIGSSNFSINNQGKKFSKNNFSAALVAESYINNIDLHYFFNAKKILLSLSIKDLIFPFHYFW